HSAADTYLLVKILLAEANAITQSEPQKYERRAEKNFSAVIAILTDTVSDDADPLLSCKRDFFLGQAYTLRGYRKRQQGYWDDAARDGLRGSQRFESYLKLWDKPQASYGSIDGVSDRITAFTTLI